MRNQRGHSVRMRLGSLALACGLLAAVPTATSGPLISGLWADTRQTGEPDEAIEIINAGGAPVDLAGWRLEDDDGERLVLPSIRLDPDERTWIARDGMAFRRTMGGPAGAEAVGADPDVPDGSGTWPLLGNAGDVIRLLDPLGAEIDVACYGSATPASGWSGPCADAGFDPAFGFDLIVARNREEGSPACVSDTDTALDWTDLRLERPGATHWLPFAAPLPERVRATVGPDAIFDLLASVVDGASATLAIGVYEFTSHPVADRIVAARARGVAVTLLLEAQSVRGPSDDGRFIAARLHAAGADVRWLRADGDEVKRYPFHHAKYVVADDRVALVATENFGPTGHPENPTWGNRGWAVAVDDARVAGWLAALLREDADLRHADVAPFDPLADGPPAGFVPSPNAASGWHRPRAGVLATDRADSVAVVVSPDHASLRGGGVLGLLASCRRTLDVEQLSLPTHWGRSADPPDLHPSALVQGILDAARRGAAVRVLLDGSWFSVDPADPRDNDDTCALLNATAASEGIPLECRLLDPAWLNLRTIHVKGLVVDGLVTHVGSMNGTSNSYRLNREVALQVTDPNVAQFYTRAFEGDWFVAGVGARVPAEVTGLRVARDPAGDLRLSWDLPPAGAPPVAGFRVQAGTQVLSDAGWARVAEVAAPAREASVAVAAPAYFIVTAFALGPGGTVEGPSGFADGFFDR